jgi:ElaB/YqjD/DUF883 family membrane-anchored ribosome-binding protein
MESALNDRGAAIRGAAKTLKTDASDAALKLREVGIQELDTLIADVQDLLVQVSHVADPEIARLRAKVEGSIASVKEAAVDGRLRLQRQAREAINASNDYAHEKPWQAIGIAALAGLAVGALVSRR